MNRFLTGLSISLLLLAGCALKAQKIDLFEENKTGHFLCGDAMDKKLGIAEFIDSRPQVERTGKKANGTYLLLWNQRKGDYITGDKDFTGFSFKKFAGLSNKYIVRSNCFFESKVMETPVPLQPSASDLLVALAKEKVDYVLLGEVKHLFGTQYQNAGMLVVPALVVNAAGGSNFVADASGTAEILFTLYDTRTGQEVWRELIQGTGTSSVRGNYTGVAKEALADANERLAEQLFKFVTKKA